jgi:hypothetical protein
MDRDVLSVVSESSARAGVLTAATRGGSLRALQSRPFRIYFIGQVASASGTFLQQTAIGWLVLRLTGSAASLGLVLAAGGVPSLLLGPWGGSLVDRVDLRKLLIATQAAFGLLAGLLWAVAAAGSASVGLVVTVGVVLDRRLPRTTSVCQFVGATERPRERRQSERRRDEQCPGGRSGDRGCADRHGRHHPMFCSERRFIRRGSHCAVGRAAACRHP